MRPLPRLSHGRAGTRTLAPRAKVAYNPSEMASVIWGEFRRRLSLRRVYLPLAAALVGLIVYVVLAATDRSSGGAQMWIPAVAVPGATGFLFVVAGAGWILQGHPRAGALRCGACGYDLRELVRRELGDVDPRCPECGSRGCATTEHPASVQLITQFPGVAAVLFGVLTSGFAMLYWALIAAGAFDV